MIKNQIQFIMSLLFYFIEEERSHNENIVKLFALGYKNKKDKYLMASFMFTYLRCI